MKPDQFKTKLISLLPRLKRYALTLSKNQADADDLLQEMCTRALTNWQKYDENQPLDRWAFTIMRNTWISEQRKKSVRQGEGQIPIEEAYDLAETTDADEQLYASQVSGKVMELPTELSSTMLLVAKEGYSYKEAAEALQVPVGTIMSRVHRARKLISNSINLTVMKGGAE